MCDGIWQNDKSGSQNKPPLHFNKAHIDSVVA